MAIAKQQVSVTRGYKAKAKRVERREPSLFQNVMMNLRMGARELCGFVADEIVYATMDTVRLLDYLRYEFGFRTRKRVQPVAHELEHFVHDHELIHDVGAFAGEKIRM